ncbi:TfdA family taurine catabolism dioxygenase TauD [Cadophora sp. DSE1049]|nr:TfdA family taurine catabolism dioxygenase TauD [Cadophora sp. DSE1049]
MAPSAIEPTVTDVPPQPKWHVPACPDTLKERLSKAGIDESTYPGPPTIPYYYQDAMAVKKDPWEYNDAGIRAMQTDKTKSSLLNAATKVTDLTTNIGTEIEGLQLKDLTSQQRDELALLIAERCVVFFRDQDITPQQQEELGKYYGRVEIHPHVPHVPGAEGATVIWDALKSEGRKSGTFRNPGGTYRWHSDIAHERQPPAYAHLHNDTIPSTGGDTVWASGYAAYDKLSPAFRQFIDGKKAVFRSTHSYVDRDDPHGARRYNENIHPIVRVHPVTGWKSLWLNRNYTQRIVGLEKAESDAILNYLYDVFEHNLDIQVRFKWTPNASALWDNRVTIHNAIWDYEGREPRHGTRVMTLGEKPYFDENAVSRRQALGLEDSE